MNHPSPARAPYVSVRTTRTLLAALAGIGGIHALQAANQTWSSAPTDANWSTITNWAGGAAPGAISANTTDIATFSSALSGGIGGSANPIVIDSGRTIGGITFDTVNVGAYQIGANAGNVLRLGSNSTTATIGVKMTSTVNAAQVIAAPIQMAAFASSTNPQYTFSNDSTNNAATLSFTGPITANVSTSRPTKLILSGSNTGNNVVSGNISNPSFGQAVAILTKSGAGTWILSGSNTFSGSSVTVLNVANGIQINGGVLVAQNNNALGSTAGSVNNYINNGGTLELNASGINGSITLNGNLTLQLLSGGTLRSNGSNATASVVNVSNAATVSSTLSTVGASDVLTVGDGANDLTGGAADSVLHVSGPGTVLLGQASNYAGTFSIDAGTLKLGNATALGSAASAGVAFGAGSTGKLAVNGQAVTIASLKSNATVGSPVVENNNAAAGSLTVGNASGSATYAGVIQDGAAGGALAIAKSGAGTLVLSGANTYTGGTTIGGGTLTAGSANALGTGPVSIASGGTLAASSLAVGGLVMTGGGGILLTDFNSQITSPGSVSISGSANLLTVGGSLAASGGTYTFLSAGTLSAAGISLTGSGVGGLTIALGDTVTVGRTNYAFTSVSNSLQLAVTGGAFNLAWNGGNASWNTTDANWQKDGAGSNIAFFTGDNITIGTADTIGVDAGGIAAGTLAVNNSGGTAALNGGALSVLSVAKSGAGSLQVNNALTSSGAITVGAGTLAVGSSGSLTGIGLTVSGGTLDIGSTNASMASVSLTGGAINGTTGVLTGTGSAFDLQSGDVGARLAGSVGLTKSTTGTVTLSGANTYTGATTINAGTLAVGGSGTLGSGSALNLGGGSLDLGGTSQAVGAVSVTAAADSGDTIGNGSLTGASYAVSNSTGNVAIAANLLANGAIGLNKTGAGTATLSGASTYTGATNVKNGSLVLDGGNDRLLSGGSVVLGDTGTTGKLVLGGAAAVNQTLSSVTTAGSGGSVVGGGATNSTLTLDVPTTTTLSVALGGAGANENNLALAKTGVGTLTLSTASTYAGGTTVNAGTLSLNNGTGAGSGAITALNGTTITAALGVGGGGVANTIALSGANANVTLTNANASGGFNGNITGGADQTLTISNSSGQNVNLNASTPQLANFLGTVAIASGNTLAFRNTSLNNGGANATFQVDGGLSTRNNGSLALGALSGSGTVSMGVSGGVNLNLIYTIGGKNIDTTFSGVIQDGDTANGKLVRVIKVGSGVQTLSGVSTYTGGTVINAGAIRLGASEVLADVGTLALGGGTLDLAGFSETLGALTLTNATASFVDFGSGTSSLLFSSITGTGALSVVNWTAGADLFKVTNDPSSLLAQISINGLAAQATNQGSYWEITAASPVPEPASFAVLAGLAGLAASGLRRRRQA